MSDVPSTVPLATPLALPVGVYTVTLTAPQGLRYFSTDVYAGGSFYFGGGAGTGIDMEFAINYSTGTPVSNIYVAPGGNVGVGTTGAPGQKLDVSGGSIRIGTTTPGNTLDVNGTIWAAKSIRVDADGTNNGGLNGNSSLLFGANATVQVTITFPTAFATVPVVTVTPRNESGTSYDDTFAATMRSVSTTQCVVNVRRVDTTGLWGQALQLSWVAIP